MIFSLQPLVTNLSPGESAWSGGASSLVNAGAGEGGFRFDRVTIGIVLKPLPSHRARYGSDRFSPVPLRAGEGWIFPAAYDGYCAWEDETQFVNVHVDGGVLEQAAPSLAPRLHDFRHVTGALDPTVATLALQLHAAGEMAPRLYRESLTIALAAQVMRVVGVESPQPAVIFDPRLVRALDYMEAHLAEDVSLEALASAASISPFHFARLFKQYVGRAPLQELIRRRIERAKILLRTTALPVAEIAWRVGYHNAARFTALFKRETGVTPGLFRTQT